LFRDQAVPEAAQSAHTKTTGRDMGLFRRNVNRNPRFEAFVKPYEADCRGRIEWA
jgi:hypothetical protein